jgi:hypothetical protein
MKQFEDKLDIVPMEKPIEQIKLKEVERVESVSPISDIEKDYENIRNKLLYAFERGIEILDNATRSVQSDPEPRAIEAASAIFKTLNDNSKELLNLHKNKNKILKELKESDTPKLKSIGSVSDILKEEN